MNIGGRGILGGEWKGRRGEEEGGEVGKGRKRRRRRREEEYSIRYNNVYV